MTNDVKTKKVPALRIHAKPKRGFRRAGFEFSFDTPRILLVEDLSKQQIEALQNEPNLVVEKITTDVPA